MAYDETLAERIRRRQARRKNVAEKKMFGGIGFLLNGNIVGGAWKDSLIARVGPDEYEAALKEAFVREFDITGKPMKGWVMVGPEGVEEDDELQAWIDRAMMFVKTLLRK